MAGILNANPLRFTDWKNQQPPEQPQIHLGSIERQPIPIIGEARPLNLSPEKAALNNPLVQDRIDQMAKAALQKQGISQQLFQQPVLPQGGPMRLSNRGFMEDFHKIYYQKEDKNPNLKNTGIRKNDSMRQSRQNQPHIDFDLEEEMLENKIKGIAEDYVRKSHQDISQKMNQRTKQIRDYIDVQMSMNGNAMQSLQDDIRSQEKHKMRQMNSFAVDNSLDLNQSQHKILNQQHSLNQMPSQFQPGPDDFKTRALKKTLAGDIQVAVIAQKIQCKPIEGHDIPLSELQKQTLNDIKGIQKAELLEVENIESMANEIKDSDLILSMLMPNQLKKATYEFLDVEDIKDVKTALVPKTKEQLEREEYEKILEKDALEVLVTDQQREKTIKCLLKVLDYQLKGVNEQAQEIETHYKKVDKDIENFNQFLKKEENRVLMDDIKFKMEQAKKQAREYEEANMNEDESKELFDVADLIVENKLLIDQVDALLGKQEESPSGKSKYDDEMSELSQSLIDKLYKQYTKKGKNDHKARINVQFGVAKVDNLPKNKGKRLQKSQTQLSPKIEVKVKSEDLERIKQQKKAELKKRIETQISPSKLQQRKPIPGSKKVENQLNRELKSAMNEMAKVMKVAFN